ncbi:hypothetical protein BH23VER1_BH23VER1_03200 [soil metagenome]
MTEQRREQPEVSDVKGTTEDKEDSEIVLREHVYDGIQEYDQKLPNWWLFTLYITIVYFVLYWFLHYQVGAFPTDAERIDSAMAAIDARKADELQKLMADLNDDVLWEMSQNQTIVDSGKDAYETNCAACHASDLSAQLNGNKLPGEPLDDGVWKYGGNPMNVLTIVRQGSPDPTKGMQAWEPILGPKKVAEVVAFVMSHHQEGEESTAPDTLE